ncbi:hypothetical protein [Carbonactinospora thermoautotrophica]|uniref:hypothetical protein n=1 Tax=Carbonactinospora thermoautotrophica TaxID=1469144 RepID=UPI002270091B|nr:hypothetical protein [Carbonactinospora thermoautotrophica]
MAAPQQAPGGAFHPTTEPTGWVLFAGPVMLVLGIFHAIAGLVALFDEGPGRVPGWLSASTTRPGVGST